MKLLSIPTPPKNVVLTDDGGTQSSDIPIGMLEETAFQSCLVEVYGPSTKRPRFEELFSATNSSAELDIGTPPPQPDATSEAILFDRQQVNLPVFSQQRHSIDDSTTTAFRAMPVGVSNADPLSLEAATSFADLTNDNSTNDPHTDPLARDYLHTITEEQDIDPMILDEIIHQLNRKAKDSTGDELFDSIIGRDWDKGVLVLHVNWWKTGETPAIMFSTCKRDYFCETADYVLRHKLGSSSARYSSGRYTRWARHSRILRRLLRSSDGQYVEREDRVPGSLNVATNLPNGTCLIRLVIGQVASNLAVDVNTRNQDASVGHS